MSVKIELVHVGTKLIADGGFGCIPPNAVLEVQYDGRELWVTCDRGRHYLDGQVDTETNTYVGFDLYAPT